MQKFFSLKNQKFLFSNLSLTMQLIILNVIIYFFSLILIGIYGEKFFLNIAITPSLFLSGKTLWTLITSMFFHGSFFHIFANMFSLYFIGGILEKIIGKKRFFWVYMIAGIMGSVFFILASTILGNDFPAVGASGAIFGILGVLAVLIPYSKIYLIIGPLILIIFEVILIKIIPESFLPLFNFVFTIIFFVMIFSLFSFNKKLRKFALPLKLPMWALPIVAIVPLSIISFFIQLPIGNSAHFGGLVIGLIYGFYLRKKFPRKIKRLSRFF
jgi:membrane associated rhomboid family serine protease